MPRWLRFVLVFLLPPLAVADKGAVPIMVTIAAYILAFPIGGSIVALYFILSRPQEQEERQRNSPAFEDEEPEDDNKRYIWLADGELAEVIDTDEAERKQHKRLRS